MDTTKDTLSDLYCPSEIADLDFDLLHDLNYDFNLLGEDDDEAPSTVIKQEYSLSPSSEMSDVSGFDPFNSVDSPPLTPPSLDALKQQLNIENENESNISLLMPNGSNSKFPKILPALKSTRGRSASHDSPDIQALKRHIRMIRNRESASLSRKKKKEYLTGLEGRCKELEIENAKLKHENCVLKSRLGQFLSSNTIGSAKTLASMLSSTSKTKNLPSVTAKIALLGLCCFVFVSFQKPTLLSPTNSTGHVKGASPQSRPIALTHDVPKLPVFDSPGKHTIRPRRSLLWSDDGTNDIAWDSRKNETAENITQEIVFTKIEKPDTFDNITLTNIPTSKCPTPFNQTDVIRVQNDLKGIFSHKPRKTPPAKPIVYSLIDVTSNDNKGLTVYDEKMRRFSRVLDQLQRRSDTFYVVSLAVESQLLLSAKSLNATSRPKMSFLMPWKNDTLGGKEEVMQIDCEVTQVFNLNHRRRKVNKRK